MLENSHLYEKFKIVLNQQILQNLLFQMRYDSLFNYKKWPSDNSKGFGTPTFWPSHNVELLQFLPNYTFSDLDFSGLE